MSYTSTVLDELHDSLRRIFQACGVHDACVGLLYLEEDGDQPPMAGDICIRSFRSDADSASKADAGEGHSFAGDKDIIYPIASLTKPLVAVAFMLAIQLGAAEVCPDERFRRFVNADCASITDIYNENKASEWPEMPPLPGEPRCDQLLVHTKAVPSMNDHIFGPEGSPLMSLRKLPDDIAGTVGKSADKSTEAVWWQYSNVNYALVCMVIEALWRGPLSDFMDFVLFQPLGMTCTSIGHSEGRQERQEGPGYSGRFVVDADGSTQPANVDEFLATGAEAGAMGGYSSIKDMLKFFNFLLRTLDGEQVINCVGKQFMRKLLGQVATSKVQGGSDNLIFSLLGYYTSLKAKQIGCMSHNRLLFPDEPFATYPVIWNKTQDDEEAYYHAGCAVGCNCCFALLPARRIAVVVLTNTSGSVDASDHALRQVLRVLCQAGSPRDMSSYLVAATGAYVSVWDHVRTAISHTLQRHRLMVAANANAAAGVFEDLIGTYQAQGFLQRLNVTAHGGHTFIVFEGQEKSSQAMALKKASSGKMRICVEPHTSVDCHGKGDWSMLDFTVEREGGAVVALRRKTARGEDCFVKD